MEKIMAENRDEIRHIIHTSKNNTIACTRIQRRFEIGYIKAQQIIKTMNFTHLHVHSHYSRLDGMAKIKELVNRCIATGMNAVALTDHGNMCGIKELLTYCECINAERAENNQELFKPIVGVEFYCARRGRHAMTGEEETTYKGHKRAIDHGGWHLILLAKNKTGYQNLCRLLSESNKEDAFFVVPRIDHELLERYHEGLICCSACIGGELPQKVLSGLQSGNLSEARRTVRWFKNLFGDDYYIELQRHQTDCLGANQRIFELESIINPILIDLAHKNNVKIICTNDVHFVHETDADAHDVLLCINTNHTIDDADRLRYTKQEWLKSPEEMAAIFSDIPEAIINTQEIADKVELYSIDNPLILPNQDIPDGYESLSQFFIAKVKSGAEFRYVAERMEQDSTLQKRIELEIKHICDSQLEAYFLFVADVVQTTFEKWNIYHGPGRSSVAGSVVAYCLGITDIDPLEYGLLFERFFHPIGCSLPQIAVDFEYCERQRIIDYLKEKYRDEHVAHLIAFTRMSAKSTISKVGEVLCVPKKDVEAITTCIIDGMTLSKNYQHVDELKRELNSTNPKIRQMLQCAERLEGTVCKAFQHMSCVVLCGEKLSDVVPIGSIGVPGTNKRVMLSEFEAHYAEDAGLLKFDVIGLKVLTVMKECLKIIEHQYGSDTMKSIINPPKDDELTFRLFQEGNTEGIFLFDYNGMRKYLKQLQPSSFEQLVAVNAMYRPGPMDFIPKYIKRMQGMEPITYHLPIMRSYLEETYGMTIYQEQMMLLSQVIANFTPEESDRLRSVVCCRRITQAERIFKEKFIDGGIKNGYNKEVLTAIWFDWSANGNYFFSKSHAVSYTWLAYKMAYLKAHYPKIFMEVHATVEEQVINKV